MRCRCTPPGSWPSWPTWPPTDVIVFDEAITTSGELTRYLPPAQPGRYLQTRGGSLGVGLPGALGLKLANPEQVVFGFAGDGGAMYTIQALWTAAHHGIGAKLVVCNNRSYQILKDNICQYWRERGLPEHEFPASFDLRDPELRFDRLAESLGIPAARVETAIADTARRSPGRSKPMARS